MFAELYTSAMYGLRLVLTPGAPADSPTPPPWLADADMQTGMLTHSWISSLSAFWPGLQALAGLPRLSLLPRSDPFMACCHTSLTTSVTLAVLSLAHCASDKQCITNALQLQGAGDAVHWEYIASYRLCNATVKLAFVL